jgi:hypothetical protein
MAEKKRRVGKTLGIIDYSELRAALADAIRKALRLVQAKHPGKRLRGFALCSDDNAVTIFPAATIKERPKELSELEWDFNPNEWEVGGNGQLAQETFEALRKRFLAARNVSSDDGPAEWKKTFESFVGALKDVRDEGLFGTPKEREQLVLMVISTDPSEDLEKMSDKWIGELNRPSVRRRFKTLLAKMEDDDYRRGERAVADDEDHRSERNDDAPRS